MFVTWILFSWISFKRNFPQSASVLVARHNGPYTGGPFEFSTLQISVRTDVLLGKRNDFVVGFQISPPCPSKSSKMTTMSVQHWRNDNQINSEKSLSQCHFTSHKSRTDWYGVQPSLTASVRVYTTSVITSQEIIGIFSENPFCGAAAKRGPRLPRFWAVKIIHKQRRTTVGWTPLVEWSARRRDLYLTIHNTHKRQTSMPPAEFEPSIPAGERLKTYALYRAATGTGILRITEIHKYTVWTNWRFLTVTAGSVTALHCNITFLSSSVSTLYLN